MKKRSIKELHSPQGMKPGEDAGPRREGDAGLLMEFEPDLILVAGVVVIV